MTTSASSTAPLERNDVSSGRDSLSASLPAAPALTDKEGGWRVECRLAHDANDQARAIAGWTQIYDQLGPGRFEGSITELRLQQMHLFSETTSRALRQTCVVTPDSYWFGIPAGEAACGRISGRVIGPDGLAVKRGNVEFELVTPEDYNIYGIVIKRDVLHHYTCEVEHRASIDELLTDETVSVGVERKAHLCRMLQIILRGVAQTAAQPSIGSQEHLQALILATLFDLSMGEPALPVPLPSRPHRQWIVSQARAYVLEHRNRPVAIPELCTQLRVSRRTLQYCFQEIYGMTPVAYLKAIRLNGVRRDLLGALGDEMRSVQDIAAKWGFWHLSQFSADYRKLFNVSPSGTLREAALLRPIL